VTRAREHPLREGRWIPAARRDLLPAPLPLISSPSPRGRPPSTGPLPLSTDRRLPHRGPPQWGSPSAPQWQAVCRDASGARGLIENACLEAKVQENMFRYDAGSNNLVLPLVHPISLRMYTSPDLPLQVITMACLSHSCVSGRASSTSAATQRDAAPSEGGPEAEGSQSSWPCSNMSDAL
jgi:hypothetical protein